MVYLELIYIKNPFHSSAEGYVAFPGIIWWGCCLFPIISFTPCQKLEDSRLMSLCLDPVFHWQIFILDLVSAPHYVFASYTVTMASQYNVNSGTEILQQCLLLGTALVSFVLPWEFSISIIISGKNSVRI